MSDLSIFGFQSKSVRVVEIDGSPWWIAVDVCEILELSNSRQSVARIDDTWKGVYTIDTLGGKQELAIVSEAGLYELIFTSRKAIAKEFKRWIFEDVIPSIRETGSYMPSVEVKHQELVGTLSDAVNESANIAEAFSRLLGTAKLGRSPEEKANLLAGTKLTMMGMRHPSLKGELMEFHKLLAASTPTPDILINPTTIGLKLGISARTVNTLLIDAGLQTRVPKEERTKGTPDYRPTAEGDRYCSNTVSTGNCGDLSTYQHIKWVPAVVDILSDFMASRSREAL